MNMERFIALVNTDPLTSGLIVVVLILFVFSFTLFLKVSKFTQGSNGKNLEGTIKNIGDRVSSLEAYARNNQKAVDHIEVRLARAVQSITTERFDPFQNAGGMQSFATAFLNEEGDGVIVSGIHSRDTVRVYAKSVSKFSSEHELSDEETRAVAKAKKELNT